MNRFFLDEQQRQKLETIDPQIFKEILTHYKKDLVTNTNLHLSEEDWQKVFRWVGSRWFEKSQNLGLMEAWQKTSEEFHRSYVRELQSSGAATSTTETSLPSINPITHPAFLEDFEAQQFAAKKRNNLGTRMIVQVFIGLVLWKILIIVFFQKACVP